LYYKLQARIYRDKNTVSLRHVSTGVHNTPNATLDC